MKHAALIRKVARVIEEEGLEPYVSYLDRLEAAARKLELLEITVRAMMSNGYDPCAICGFTQDEHGLAPGAHCFESTALKALED